MRLTFEANNISEVRELHQMLTRLLAPEAIEPKRALTGNSIGELGLSTNAFNSLISANIDQISQLMMLKDSELLAIPCIGKVAFCEIKDKLAAFLR